MSLRDALHRLRETQRRHGVYTAALFAWSALDRGSKRLYLYGLSEPRAVPEAAHAARSHTFRLATAEEIAAGVGGTWSARDVDAVRRGDRCLVQRDGDRLVGYTWTSVSPLVFITDGLHLNLPEDAAYIYRAYTLPEYRGRGFQALRGLELLRLLATEGKRRLVSYVARDNFESLKGIRKTGYERIGEIRLTRRKGEVHVSIKVSSAFWCDLRRV